MRRLASLLVLTAIGSAIPAVAGDRDPISWEQVGDHALRTAMNELVGPDAIDCGFVDLRYTKAKDTVKRVALDCLATAEARRLPFKFGVARLPMGAVSYEVYAKSANGQSWLLGHGRNLLEGELQSSMQRCLLITVSPRTLFISGSDCSQFKLLSQQGL